MQLNGQGLDDGRQGDLQQYFRNKPLWSTSCSVFFSDRSTVLNCDRRAFSQLRTFNRSKSRHRRRYCGGGIDSPGNVAFVLWRKHQKNSVPPYLTGRSNDDVDGKGELAGTKAVRGSMLSLTPKPELDGDVKTTPYVRAAGMPEMEHHERIGTVLEIDSRAEPWNQASQLGTSENQDAGASALSSTTNSQQNQRAPPSPLAGPVSAASALYPAPRSQFTDH